MKTVVVGGGIAGLAIAWRLCREGSPVEIIERGICGRAASWAAAGMLAPGGELAGETRSFARFAHQSRQAWPAFVSELENATGLTVSYRESGSLLVARTEEHALSLRKTAGSSAHWLSRDELLKREPFLSPEVWGALNFPGDAQVDNRAVCMALHAALVANGVIIHENCELRSVVTSGGKARSLLTDRGAMEADKIVLACGASINSIGGTGLDLPRVKPVKGQMVACVPPAGISLPKALIWSDGVYLAPRPDRVLIGATVEDAGFDIAVERRAWEHLSLSAARLIPSFSQWTLCEFWAGLRPRGPDDAPILGETAISGLYVAGGQFRNGILFAPAVADLMAAVLREKDAGEFASEFSPLRFTGRAVTR